MESLRPPQTPPPPGDGEVVRVIRKRPSPRGRLLPWGIAVLAVAGMVTGWWMLAPAHGRDAPASNTPTGATSGPDRAAPAPASTATGNGPVSEYQAMSGKDPEDLASYFKPGDPEPTGAELIEALHETGVRTGIGAFNPPGTSPPLLGLAVPEDFQLPPGYARHHQSTDQGMAIEPILVFSPGFSLHDAQGKPVRMPADGVVPPELAPPGLPLRRIRIPSP